MWHFSLKLLLFLPYYFYEVSFAICGSSGNKNVLNNLKLSNVSLLGNEKFFVREKSEFDIPSTILNKGLYTLDIFAHNILIKRYWDKKTFFCQNIVVTFQKLVT